MVPATALRPDPSRVATRRSYSCCAAWDYPWPRRQAATKRSAGTGLNSISASWLPMQFRPKSASPWAKTPSAAVTRLHKAMLAALADKDVVQRIEDHGAVIDPSSPEALGQTVRQEIAKWCSMVTQAKLSVD